MTVATNPLTYNGWVNAVATLAVVDTIPPLGSSNAGVVVVGVDAPFNDLLPNALNYAELRIQRDLDLIQSQVAKSYTLASASNLLAVPVSDFVTLQTIAVTSTGAPLLPASKEFIQTVYGNPATTGEPHYFAVYGGDAASGGNTTTNVLVGPYTDVSYTFTVTGTTRLPSLYQYANVTYANTQTTFISTWLPDLLLQASMILITQFQRNFGPASNDPQMGPSYETQYQTLLKGAVVEEARKRFWSSAWSSQAPATIATPSRGAT